MEKVKTFFGKVWGFTKKHKWSLLLVFTALAIAGFFLWDSFTAQNSLNLPGLNLRPKKEERVRAPLSGRLVSPELAKRNPVAVVIENSPEARPQSGLNGASLVYETFAEGGITRFLVFFQENEPQEIGPVRSARAYFVKWAKSYNALFAHVGGSSEAISLIDTLKVYDLNQFYFGSYFWRDAKRYAPHNVYTTLAKLYEAAKTKGYPTSSDTIPALQFKDDAKEEERATDFSFSVNFNAAFAPTYAYSRKDNLFYRSMPGQKQTDRVTGEQITAKNVVVAFSDFSYGTTSTGEQSTKIRVSGSGNITYFIDGVRKNGTWRANTETTPMRFYDQSGSELKLNAGTTWIEVAPIGTVVK
jgi:hypothetical protein